MIPNNTPTEEIKKISSKKSRKAKKFLAGMTACVIALGCMGCLTGCSKDTDSTTTPEDNSSVVSDEETPAETEAPTLPPDPEKAGLAAYSANYDITDKMFACYYQDMISMFRNVYGDDTLLNYYQMDVSKPLKDQPYPTNDGTSWFDNVVTETATTIRRQLVLAEAGKAAGFEMPDSAKDEIENTIKNAELDVYGNDVSIDDLRATLEIQGYSSSYYNAYVDSLNITDDDIQKYVDENKKDFETCGLIGFAITYKLDENATEATDEEGNAIEDDDDSLLTKDEAKELADKLQAAKTPEEFTEIILGYLVAYENYTDEDLPSAEASIKNDSFPYSAGNRMAEWAFGDEAKLNDVLLLEDSDETNNRGYYYLYMLSREPSIDNTKTVNVRHILFNINAHMEDDDEDAAFEECKKLAEETLEEWKSGDATEESFAELAKEKTEDPGSVTTGGLYENVSAGQMVQPFNDWIFDDSRKAGDTDIIKTSYGYHIMYYVSDNDPAWKTNAENILAADAYDTWYSEQEFLYPVNINEDVMKGIDG